MGGAVKCSGYRECVRWLIGGTLAAWLGNEEALIVSALGGTPIMLIGMASLVLGMGLPVTASYIVLVILAGPALMDLGLPFCHCDQISMWQIPASLQLQLLFLMSDMWIQTMLCELTGHPVFLVAMKQSRFSCIRLQAVCTRDTGLTL